MGDGIHDRKEFGRLMKASGIKICELAILTGYSRNAIYQYIDGSSFPRSLETFEKICGRCNINISSLDLVSLVGKKYVKSFAKYIDQVDRRESAVDKLDGGAINLLQDYHENRFSGYRINNEKTIIIGKSDSMKDVFSLLDQITGNPDQDSVVLIRGETGTGKELVARAIHYNGKRNQSPYLGINITSVDNDLIESELFGHRKGAFTSAVYDKKGFLEEVSTGTLLIDEIASLSRQAQVKLLRVLQERNFYRVGDTKPINFNGRIIVTTNGDLEELVKSGSFRQDLFYRMDVVTLKIPPLRERGEDVIDLFSYFVYLHNNKYGTSFNLEPTQDGAKFLLTHSFPGNVRELENLVKKAIFISRDDYVRVEDCTNGFVIETQQHKGNGKTDRKNVFIEEIKRMAHYETMNPIERAKLETVFVTYFDCYGNPVLTSKRLGYTGSSYGSGLREYFRSLGIGSRMVRLAYFRTCNIDLDEK